MPNKSDADMLFDSLNQMMIGDDETVEATQAQRDYYADLQSWNV